MRFKVGYKGFLQRVEREFSSRSKAEEWLRKVGKLGAATITEKPQPEENNYMPLREYMDRWEAQAEDGEGICSEAEAKRRWVKEYGGDEYGRGYGY